MSELPVIVLGAGGHGAVIADALLASGRQVLGFTDRVPAARDARVCGLPILGSDEVLQQHDPGAVELANGIGGIGDAAARRRRELQTDLRARGWRFASVRHPSAVVSPFALLDEGVQILERAVVQVGATLGTGCILNFAATVGHHARVGAWTHVAPSATLCGDVVVGERCHIGADATLRQGVRLGDDVLVGAGALVLEDFGGRGTLVGLPARQMEERQR